VTAVDPSLLEELYGWLRIPSVSADPAHAEDVRAAGQWVCDFVAGAGGSARLVETGGHPLAVGEIPASTDPERAPTVLVYGHFDVQPPGDPALWRTEPFEPVVVDGWLHGRGAADDKGQLFLVLEAARSLARSGELPVNVRVACDGEEETGGNSIVGFLAEDERGADACLIFDGGMPRRGVPAFEIATRGIVYYHLSVRTGTRDLHSGVFGGAALNALHALADILRAVSPPPEELRAGTAPPTAEELESWRELDPGEHVLAEQGARPLDATAAEEFYLRTFAAPAVDVNGVQGGSPDLQKTVLPVTAVANVSMRLAPGQDPEAIDETFQRLLREATPIGAELEIERWALNPPGLVSPDAPALRLAQEAFQRVVGRRPLLLRTGGTIPIVPALSARGIPTILTGFDLPEGNIHAPNERLLLDHFPLGIAAARETFLALGELGHGESDG
jgi:acetylornithine deacetylase/succinyl-diaminopimelate desuccinylase-like protein